MNVCEATAKRINQLLKEKGMTQYRLEQKSGNLHGSMACIMNGRNKTVTLSTIYMLARGFDMSIIEFLNNEIFLSEDVGSFCYRLYFLLVNMWLLKKLNELLINLIKGIVIFKRKCYNDRRIKIFYFYEVEHGCKL